MFKCPRCRNEGISIWGKYQSGLWWPATCKFCGAKVTNQTNISIVVYALQFLTGLYFAVEAIITRTVTSIVVFLIVWLGFDVVRILFVPLVEQSTKMKTGSTPLPENEQKWGEK